MFSIYRSIFHFNIRSIYRSIFQYLFNILIDISIFVQYIDPYFDIFRYSFNILIAISIFLNVIFNILLVISIPYRACFNVVETTSDILLIISIHVHQNIEEDYFLSKNLFFMFRYYQYDIENFSIFLKIPSIYINKWKMYIERRPSGQYIFL